MAEIMELRVKRAYDDAEASDGFRVLVDRLWPRGVTKQRAAVDLWAKDVAPSPELRKAWHAANSDAAHADCEDRYRAELADESAPALAELAEQLKGKKTVTLLFGLKDVAHNHAKVLAKVLKPLL